MQSLSFGSYSYEIRDFARIARPNDLDTVVAFYRDGLGLAELYRVEQQ